MAEAIETPVVAPETEVEAAVEEEPTRPSDESLKEKAIQKAEEAETNPTKITSDINTKRTRSLSISSLTNVEEEKETEQEAYTSEERVEFSDEEFNQHWNDLAEIIKKDGKEGSSMVQ